MENTFTSSSYQVTVDDLSWDNVCTITSKMDINRAWVMIAQDLITLGYHKGIINTLDYEQKGSSISSPSQRLFHYFSIPIPNFHQL